MAAVSFRLLPVVFILSAILAGGVHTVQAYQPALAATPTPPQVPLAQESSHGLYLPSVLSGSVPSGGTPTATSTPTASAYSIAGYAQKGPFVLGSEITVRELDSNFVPTGRTFTGRIEDSTGRFTIRGTLNFPFVELAASGFYFNEVSGSLSAAPISLLALADLRDNASVNVNLLTHLEHGRVLALLDSGLAFGAAKLQAQAEVLAAFNLGDQLIGRSETLDISQPGTGNAILLAISAILQGSRSEAQLTELLSSFSNDLRTDGMLDSAAGRQALVSGMEYIKSRRTAIRSNIVARYAELGAPADVPAFEDYAFALDMTEPTVASSSPGAGSDQEVHAVTIVFSELMQHSTLTGSSVSVLDSSGVPVAGTLLAGDTDSATSVEFAPTGRLLPGSYRLIVGTGARDLAGNRLAADVEIGFVHTPISELAAGSSGPTRLGSATVLSASIPGGGSAVVYTWDFGDGASGAGSLVTHTYSVVGTYLASATAVNGEEQHTATVSVNVIDRAIIGLHAANSGPTRLGSSTTFTATTVDGSNVDYVWNFGDDETANGAETRHRYAAVGSYTATVTAANGVSEMPASTVVTVIDRAVTGLAFTSTESYPDYPTMFTASVLDGSNVTYAWSFGDGASGIGPSVTHTYGAAGAYTVTVAAANGFNRELLSETIHVFPKSKVLVLGHGRGADTSAELYDPATAAWTATGVRQIGRELHTATRLKDGRVLVVGGSSGAAEIYDPVIGTWSLATSPRIPRYHHTATLLADGRVLVAGGYDYTDQTIASAELYDPATGTWSDTGSFRTGMAGHKAVLLNDGKVLAIDFWGSELYDPATGMWSPTGAPTIPARTATLLATGNVLIIDNRRAQLYDPESETWSETGSLNDRRTGHTATLMRDGKLLVAGGRYNYDGSDVYLSSAEVYDPESETWASTGDMDVERYEHTATLLPNGKVLATGGYRVDAGCGCQVYLASAEVYDPASDTWSSVGSMTIRRAEFTATLLDGGQ